MSEMKIWILNHYATDMFFDKIGRHQCFGKYLIRNQHEVDIFCASTVHNSDINVDTEGKLSTRKIGEDQVPYTFVKTSPYSGNGKSRIFNMMEYFFRIKKVLKQRVAEEGRPDIILASSVHPFTLVAGIQFAKKIGCPCICEVRDLWPESIVSFTNIAEKNPAVKFLYKMEKWIYKKADALIFTMEGGAQYIKDKGWDNVVDLAKVNHINNGVDLDVYDYNKNNIVLENRPESDDKKKIVYAGSIRPANNVFNLALAAERIRDAGIDNIEFIIYGDGPDRSKIEEYIKEKELTNIRMMGRIEKKYIPGVLSIENSVNCLNYQNSDVFRYGGSQNKLFEYLASGRPVLANVKMGYDIIEKYNAGITASTDDIEGLIAAVIDFADMDGSEYEEMCNNARKAAKDYDFKVLTNRLEKLMESLVK